MSHLFGGGQTPKPTPVAAMPDDQDQAAKDAQKRAAAAIQQRSGRASTILTNPSNREQTGGYSGPAPYSTPVTPTATGAFKDL